MFVALDENNNRVDISNASKDKTYYCEACRQKLIVKTSDIIRSHFSHYPENPKTGYKKCIDTWDYELDEWKYNLMNKFPFEFREIIIRNKDGEVHKADICIGKYIYLFLTNSIEYEKFKAKNDFFINLGYKTCWILNFINIAKKNTFHTFTKIDQWYDPIEPFDKIPEGIHTNFIIDKGKNQLKTVLSYKEHFRTIKYKSTLYIDSAVKAIISHALSHSN